MAVWRIVSLVFGVAVLIAYIGLSGKWVTTNADWYLGLNAPAWQPPNWVFGAAWTYNFIVLGVAAVLLALRAEVPLVLTFLICFAISVLFAVLWAYRFYVDHALTSAAVCLTLAAVITLGMTIAAFAYAPWLGWILVPYQVWVLLATSLSWGYATMNA